MHVYHVPNCAYMYILIKSSHVAFEFAIITFIHDTYCYCKHLQSNRIFGACVSGGIGGSIKSHVLFLPNSLS